MTSAPGWTPKLTNARSDTRLMRAAVLLMGLLLATAGCLGIGGDSSDDASSETGETQAGGDAGANGTDNATGGTQEHDHEPEPEPHWDNRTGEVPGPGLVVGSVDVEEENLSVPDTAKTLEVTLQAESGEIRAELYPPDCEESGGGFGESCSETMDTFNDTAGRFAADGGQSSFSTPRPSPGNWSLVMAKGDPGPASVPYTVTFFYVDEHEPEAGHHS